MPNKKKGPPKKTKGDTAHAVARGVLGAIPFAGSSAIEVLNAVITPPLERRREAWMNDIGERLEELEANGFDLGALQQNEEFISTLLYASSLAVRTHHEEKLTALRNAVINTALEEDPDDTVQHMFLALVDSLTVLHLQLLKFFQNPGPPPGGISMGGLNHIIEAAFPELRGRKALYEQIVNELNRRGLLAIGNLNVTMSAAGLSGKRTTALGDKFLNFIE